MTYKAFEACILKSALQDNWKEYLSKYCEENNVEYYQYVESDSNSSVGISGTANPHVHILIVFKR